MKKKNDRYLITTRGVAQLGEFICLGGIILIAVEGGPNMLFLLILPFFIIFQFIAGLSKKMLQLREDLIELQNKIEKDSSRESLAKG